MLHAFISPLQSCHSSPRVRKNILQELQYWESSWSDMLQKSQEHAPEKKKTRHFFNPLEPAANFRVKIQCKISMVRLRPFIAPRILGGGRYTIHVIYRLLKYFRSLNGVHTAAAIVQAFTSLEKCTVLTKLADQWPYQASGNFERRYHNDAPLVERRRLHH